MNVKKIVQDKWTKQKGKNEIKKKHTNKQTKSLFMRITKRYVNIMNYVVTKEKNEDENQI